MLQYKSQCFTETEGVIYFSKCVKPHLQLKIETKVNLMCRFKLDVSVSLSVYLLVLLSMNNQTLYGTNYKYQLVYIELI
jgi:hypothetical protein